MIKEMIRNILYKFGGVVSHRKFSKKINYKILGKNSHYFCGYYDFDPISIDSKSILCHKISNNYTVNICPPQGEVGIISIDTGEFQYLSKTNALNWQLGSRVQWLSGNEIIFNDIVENFHCSKIVDINTRKINKTFNRAFWAISPDKKIGGSLNFSRIHTKRPGYGYPLKSIDGKKEVLNLFSINDGKSILTLSIDQILENINFDHSGQSDPYLNHIAWSPCSSKLLTIFHFAEKQNMERKIYPVLVDLNKKKCKLIHDVGYFSHHVWLNNEQLLAYIMLNGNYCFAIWNEDEGWVPVENSLPRFDGHPYPVNKTNSVVVDSYPNRFGRMSLYIGSSISNERLEKILEIYNPISYKGPLRCDLHPRVSKNNKFIICDIPSYDGRKILLIENAFNEK